MDDPFNTGYHRGAYAAYKRPIQEHTGCKDDECGAVERLMRDIYGVLDGLDRARFRREARKAYKVALQMWAEEEGAHNKVVV